MIISREKLEKYSQDLYETHQRMKDNTIESRKLSRIYFSSAIAGGTSYFFLLSGPRLRMSIWKVIIYLYSISFVSKSSGFLSLIIYSSYFK
ncbi:unnamed protein product [Blepharisma stoltei]|uniref:Uncharacterized protein n=1 Tax=Blepharisma stoltei TaxID=1481888 RepID=A0AAU9IHB5_9CILI|nr:unnamed protein product [Blepharisma stoltei]